MKKICVLMIFCLLCSATVYAEENAVRQSILDTLGTSPRLKMIQHNRDAVYYDLQKSKGRWYPRLDVRLGEGTDAYDSSVTRSNGDDHRWDHRSEAAATLTQRLYDGGEASGQIHLDEYRLNSLEYRVFDNAEALALDAAIAALEVHRQRELLVLAERNAQAHKDILESLSERERGGVGSVADVTQTEGRLAMAQASLQKTITALQAALSNYKRLTGHDAGKISMPAYPDVPLLYEVDSVLAEAVANNPKLLAAIEDVHGEKERIQIAKSAYHPNINLELSSRYSDGVDDQRKYTMAHSAMVRLNWNLCNGGSDAAATRAATARLHQTQADHNDLLLTIEDEVNKTWAQYVSAQKEVTEYRQALKNNQDTRASYLEQFGVAQRSLLDVLDAENEVFQSASQLKTSEINEHLAAYKLLALSGKLISSFDIEPKSYQANKYVIPEKVQ